MLYRVHCGALLLPVVDSLGEWAQPTRSPSYLNRLLLCHPEN